MATECNECCRAAGRSLDFTCDSLTGRRKFRTLNVVDDYNREALGVEVDYSLPSIRVIRFLDQLVERYGKPKRIRSDNGPEFISQALQAWCSDNNIEQCWIELGKPTQNAYIERFNGTFRREVLDAHILPASDR